VITSKVSWVRFSLVGNSAVSSRTAVARASQQSLGVVHEKRGPPDAERKHLEFVGYQSVESNEDNTVDLRDAIPKVT
jgi:hypothetical protein